MLAHTQHDVANDDELCVAVCVLVAWGAMTIPPAAACVGGLYVRAPSMRVCMQRQEGGSNSTLGHTPSLRALPNAKCCLIDTFNSISADPACEHKGS